ncbi:MAG TPA: F0F1 ATP synthase subunit alpha [Candidatus Dormibacteraeota bacterium]|nr:F0F1 ATP synthase subunit alpha [Candidatus Dormibacteraeota bacterium]
MSISAAEIGQIIKRKIADFDAPVVSAESGVITTLGDGIAQIYGLEGAMAGELLAFPHDILGMALNLEEDQVRAIILGRFEELREGDEVRTTGRVVEVPVGRQLVGRVVNALGQPIDGKGEIATEERLPVERQAPGVIDRQPVNTPVQTGIKAIDALIPIGRGQRELIIGDRQIGKTAIAIDTIINQKGKNLTCIYVAIGQNAASVARIAAVLEQHGALEHTIIVAATSGEPAALQYLVPYTGCSMGEWFMERGEDALIVYDDLSKHAWAYREISLALRRPPGREAYPGDVFYLHSRLLERAARLSDEKGGGSLTALPIIETQANDVAAYIPTNVISITDGQIYLEGDLFYAGTRPAVSVGLSVSRVGGDAMTKALRSVAGGMRLDLAQFRALAAFAQFSSDLDKTTRDQLDRGRRLTELLKQDQYQPVSLALQVMTIFAGTRGYLDEIPVERVADWDAQFRRYAGQALQKLEGEIESKQVLDEAMQEQLRKALEEFNQGFDSGAVGAEV